MQPTKKASRSEMIQRHESPDYGAFEEGAAEPANFGSTSGPSPISMRLSRPLLDALDRLAASQHRKRSNLIQHILWEYVHANDEPN